MPNINIHINQATTDSSHTVNTMHLSPPNKSIRFERVSADPSRIGSLDYRRMTHAANRRISGISYVGNNKVAASLLDSFDVCPA